MEIISELVYKAPYHADLETRKKLRAEYAVGGLAKFVAYLENVVSRNTVPYCVGSSLTVADLALAGTVHSVTRGNFDGIPTDYFKPYTHITKIYENVMTDPDVQSELK